MNNPNVGRGAVQALIMEEVGARSHAENPLGSRARIPVNRLFYPTVATEENDVIPPLPRYRPPKKAKAKKTRRTYR